MKGKLPISYRTQYFVYQNLKGIKSGEKGDNLLVCMEFLIDERKITKRS